VRLPDQHPQDRPQRDPAPTAAVDLIVIGAQKCGTTSLHNYLGLHPEISMSRRKETNFFLADRDWSRGIPPEVSRFDPSARLRGETCPDYTNLPHSTGTADRIRSGAPNAKLIYLVRDPVERMLSHYMHARTSGGERRALTDAVSDPESQYLMRSRYATQLKPFIELFPREQILIESQERLLQDRHAVMRRIFAFLGVDDSFTSSAFERLWASSRGRGTPLNSGAWQLAKWTRRRGIFLPQFLRWPAQRVMRLRLGGSRIEREVSDERVPWVVGQQLRDELRELRELTGFELPGA
jgi:Sulfotransferase domain